MMQADTRAPVSFFLTGRCAAPLSPVQGLGLRPALFAGYRDLAALRYDFPVVLVARPKGGPAVQSLSAVFDRALERAAEGPDGERVRQHALRLEHEIRRTLAAGGAGNLSELIDQAAVTVGRDVGFEDSRRRLRAALPCNGDLADCDAALPRRLLRHVWLQQQGRRMEALRQRLQRLTLRLSALLEAEVERSPAGVTPQRMAATVGPGFAEAFDFEALSRVLSRLPRETMPAARRHRIRFLLRELGTQRFCPLDEEEGEAYGFEFDGCGPALKAWRERLSKLAALNRAMAMAELEVRGEYDPARHDPLFQSDDALPGPAELAGFPDYLVCIPASRLDGAENARLMEILSSDLPIKVLLQTDDLGGAAGGELPAMRSRQVASLAMCVNAAYVLQASASHLLQYRQRVERGFAFAGPALFSVYSGAGGQCANLPAYLLAAAAMEARVFPAFVYDPAAGSNWAERFTLEGNPQVERDWPVRPFGYEDAQHQSVARELSFTAVDFLAADARQADSLACAPHDAWNGLLVDVEGALGVEGEGLPQRIPSLPMIDAHDRLHQVVVTRGLLRQATRCRDLWRSLQEQAGIHNSHAQRLLAKAEAEWRERERELQAAQATASAAAMAAQPAAAAPVAARVAAPAAPTPAEPEAAEEPQHAPGEAYIETPRCSSCNECVQLNPKMFAYDANQQAYIADPAAGTYAQLVEAAESCQVAVIHPGKPRNADEPGLEELLKRAEAFA